MYCTVVVVFVFVVVVVVVVVVRINQETQGSVNAPGRSSATDTRIGVEYPT